MSPHIVVPTEGSADLRKLQSISNLGMPGIVCITGLLKFTRAICWQTYTSKPYATLLCLSNCRCILQCSCHKRITVICTHLPNHSLFLPWIMPLLCIFLQIAACIRSSSTSNFKEKESCLFSSSSVICKRTYFRLDSECFLSYRRWPK